MHMCGGCERKLVSNLWWDSLSLTTFDPGTNEPGMSGSWKTSHKINCALWVVDSTKHSKREKNLFDFLTEIMSPCLIITVFSLWRSILELAGQGQNSYAVWPQVQSYFPYSLCCSDYGLVTLPWDQELAGNSRSPPKIAVSKWEYVLTMSSHYFLSGMLFLVNEGENCQWQFDNYPQPRSTEVTFSHKLGSGLHGNPEASYVSNMSQQQELNYKLCQEFGCAKGWVRLVTLLDGGKGSR